MVNINEEGLLYWSIEHDISLNSLIPIMHLLLTGILTSLADEHVLSGNYEMGTLMAKDALEIANHANHSVDDKNIYAAYAGIR
jgi:hypothetical protein